MAMTLVSSFLNALTAQGQADIWQRAWTDNGPPLPDTAAFILAPTNLLSGPPLSSLALGALTLDPKSYASMNGLITVSVAGNTGLIVANFIVTLSTAASNFPVGMALFNQGNGHLWYLSALQSWPQNMGPTYTWSANVTLNTPCQGS